MRYTRLAAMCLAPLVLLVGRAAVRCGAAEPVKLELAGVQKIWDEGNHNAFTDLTRFDRKFFCVFREGKGHVSPDGAIRVLESVDGKDWKSAALIQLDGQDLRDPKLCHTPQGQLMIVGGAAKREGTKTATEHRSFVCFSDDGKTWSEPKCDVAEQDWWLWRVTWHGKEAFGVAYGCSAPAREASAYATRLLHSKDGKKFSVLAELSAEGGPTEATLRFGEDGTCYCLQRRDGKPNTALLGVASPPYEQWTWRDLGKYYGGPNFLALPAAAGKSPAWIAAGRIITKDKGARTVLCQLDVEQGKLIELLELPSGGDTSYPGLVWHDDKLWVSYYSSHEGKTSVYLAQVNVTP